VSAFAAREFVLQVVAGALAEFRVEEIDGMHKNSLCQLNEALRTYEPSWLSTLARARKAMSRSTSHSPRRSTLQ